MATKKQTRPAEEVRQELRTDLGIIVDASSRVVQTLAKNDDGRKGYARGLGSQRPFEFVSSYTRNGNHLIALYTHSDGKQYQISVTQLGELK